MHGARAARLPPAVLQAEGHNCRQPQAVCCADRVFQRKVFLRALALLHPVKHIITLDAWLAVQLLYARILSLAFLHNVLGAAGRLPPVPLAYAGEN
jgi:hypothetical protein